MSRRFLMLTEIGFRNTRRRLLLAADKSLELYHLIYLVVSPFSLSPISAVASNTPMHMFHISRPLAKCTHFAKSLAVVVHDFWLEYYE